MDRDKIIAVILVVGFVFLFFALLGVVTITGFVLFFMNPDSGSNPQEPNPEDDVPIISTVGTGTSDTAPPQANEEETEEPAQETPKEEEPSEEPAPVCGNDKKETGEQCEADSDCSSTQQCSASCQCENKPAEKALLTGIKVDSLTFWCAPDFKGQRGLAIKIINFKNTGSTDFTNNGVITIKADTAGTTDLVTAKSSFKFSAKAGKTASIYGTNLSRTDSPYIFLGNKVETTKLTIEFGDSKYVEYEHKLKGNDFGSVGCQ